MTAALEAVEAILTDIRGRAAIKRLFGIHGKKDEVGYTSLSRLIVNDFCFLARVRCKSDAFY